MDEELDIKEPNVKIQGKIVELGSCVICGKPVKVAAAVHKIYDKTNTCSRECGELLNRIKRVRQMLGLSQFSPGDEIEYQINVGSKHRPNMKTKNGRILQITDKIISVQGEKYRSSIDLYDLDTGETKITKLRGVEFELTRIDTSIYDNEFLKSLYVKHKCSISQAAQEINWSYATLKNTMVNRGLLDPYRTPRNL